MSVLLYNVPLFGAWRSLAARFVRVEEVVGSNPAAPTNGQTAVSQMGNGRFIYPKGIEYPAASSGVVRCHLFTPQRELNIPLRAFAN